MKLIILEGPDRTGKSTLIKGICEHYNYDNVTIRHFGKPPKNMSPIMSHAYQFACFDREAEMYKYVKDAEKERRSEKYYDEVMIWNRSHLGEFVYAQMFRQTDAEHLQDVLEKFEDKTFGDENVDVYLITLAADPEFLLSKEDGQSFSQTVEQKEKEMELFVKAHFFSCINNKLLVKVEESGEFRPKQDIINQVIKFIDNNDNS